MWTATGNHVLDALDESMRKPILQASKDVEIPRGAWLYRQGSTATHLYFPTSGVGSIVSSTSSGKSGGLIITGRMSAPGAEAILSDAAMETSCYFHTQGKAIRVGVADARDLFELDHQGPVAILASIRKSLLLAQKTAICNAVHTAHQRFAHWCLMFCDVSGGDVVWATQEKLAELLMTQRSTVSMVANEYRRQGLINIRRGIIPILNPEVLEKQTCDCYALFRQLYPGLGRIGR